MYVCSPVPLCNGTTKTFSRFTSYSILYMLHKGGKLNSFIEVYSIYILRELLYITLNTKYYFVTVKNKTKTSGIISKSKMWWGECMFPPHHNSRMKLLLCSLRKKCPNFEVIFLKICPISCNKLRTVKYSKNSTLPLDPSLWKAVQNHIQTFPPPFKKSFLFLWDLKSRDPKGEDGVNSIHQ